MPNLTNQDASGKDYQMLHEAVKFQQSAGQGAPNDSFPRFIMV